MNSSSLFSSFRSGGTALCALLLMGLVAGCAEAPPASDKEAMAEYDRINDPLEPWNRHVYAVNKTIDDAAIKPAAMAYREYVPEFVQNRVRDFFNNLTSPEVFGNDLLQGHGFKAAETFTRFTVNSTFGIGGLFDIAGRTLPRHEADLGETLGVWGVGEGPYLLLPVFGPSNPRDLFGLAVESYFDPFDVYARNMGYYWVSFPRGVVTGLERRADNLDSLDEIERTSIDPYSTIRSLYRQYREAQIQGKPTADKPRPGLTGEFPTDPELSQENN